jgi:hypothetical protein
MWFLIAASLVLADGAAAWGADETGASARSITVSGVGSVLVVPDYAIVRVGVDYFDAQLDAAKLHVDDAAKRLIELTRRMSIEPADVKSDRVSIALRYASYSNYDAADRTKVVGYSASTSISIALRDLRQLDERLSEAIKAGANRLDEVDFRTSKLREHRDAARKLALRAAKEKATLMAGELDTRIGKPLQICEATQYPYGGLSPMANSQYQAQASADDLSRADSDSPIAPGQISVTAELSVTFALE